MKDFHAMQYVRNLCVKANDRFRYVQKTKDNCLYMPGALIALNSAYDEIKSACSMMKVYGSLIALSRDGISGEFRFITVFNPETDEVCTTWIPRTENENDVNEYEVQKKESYICFATSMHGTYGRIESTYPHLYNAFESTDLAWIFMRQDLLKG